MIPSCRPGDRSGEGRTTEPSPARRPAGRCASTPSAACFAASRRSSGPTADRTSSSAGSAGPAFACGSIRGRDASRSATCFPTFRSRSTMDRAFRAWVRDRSSEGLPEHRRIDPRRLTAGLHQPRRQRLGRARAAAPRRRAAQRRGLGVRRAQGRLAGERDLPRLPARALLRVHGAELRRAGGVSVRRDDLPARAVALLLRLASCCAIGCAAGRAAGAARRGSGDAGVARPTAGPAVDENDDNDNAARRARVNATAKLELPGRERHGGLSAAARPMDPTRRRCRDARRRRGARAHALDGDQAQDRSRAALRRRRGGAAGERRAGLRRRLQPVAAPRRRRLAARPQPRAGHLGHHARSRGRRRRDARWSISACPTPRRRRRSRRRWRRPTAAASSRSCGATIAGPRTSTPVPGMAAASTRQGRSTVTASRRARARATSEIHYLSATALAAAIRARRISSREALDALAARIERHDRALNLVVTLDLERARRDAAAADEELARGKLRGPLHGLPMTIKDSYQTAGLRTTSGAPELARVRAARGRRAGGAAARRGRRHLRQDQPADLRRRRAELQRGVRPVEQPLGRRRAAPVARRAARPGALAAGFTPLELGSDIGGSIRNPSHCCGVVGHKPSYGLVPAHGQIPGPPGTLTQADIAVAGPMARSVEDLEVALDILAGPGRLGGGGLEARAAAAAPPATARLPARGVDRRRASARCRARSRGSCTPPSTPSSAPAPPSRATRGPTSRSSTRAASTISSSAPRSAAASAPPRSRRWRRASPPARTTPGCSTRRCVIAPGCRPTSGASRCAGSGSSSSRAGTRC